MFTVDPDELSETGFFKIKLFVFSKYVDMDWLKQKSAFKARDTRKVRRKAGEAEIWDAWVSATTVYR